MDLNSLYDIIPDEEQWTKSFNLKNRICSVSTNDTEVEKTAKVISSQIIDFIRQTPITSFDKKETECRSICGLYSPQDKLTEFNKKNSYGLSDQSDVKTAIERILSEYFNVYVVNTSFSCDVNETCDIDISLDSYVYVEIDFV